MRHAPGHRRGQPAHLGKRHRFAIRDPREDEKIRQRRFEPGQRADEMLGRDGDWHAGLQELSAVDEQRARTLTQFHEFARIPGQLRRRGAGSLTESDECIDLRDIRMEPAPE